jgi:hypothetical protein
VKLEEEEEEESYTRGANGRRALSANTLPEWTPLKFFERDLFRIAFEILAKRGLEFRRRALGRG